MLGGAGADEDGMEAAVALATSSLVGKLVPSKVEICGHEDCDCLYGRWNGAGGTRVCPLHSKPSTELTVHNDMLRRVVTLVYGFDEEACMLPEFSVRCVRNQHGKFVKARVYRVDLVVVLGSGHKVSFECDGTSHDESRQCRRDATKAMNLKVNKCCLHRLNIRDGVSKQQSMQQLYDRELAKVRAFLKKKPWLERPQGTAA